MFARLVAYAENSAATSETVNLAADRTFVEVDTLILKRLPLNCSLFYKAFNVYYYVLCIQILYIYIFQYNHYISHNFYVMRI